MKTVRMFAIGALAAVLALLGATLPASAASVAPLLLTGNQPCDGLKVEPVASGTYGAVTITVHGSSFDFSTSDGTVVSDVLVKGGPNTNWYHYDPAVTSDSNLTAPENPHNGKTYGLSHICFSVDDKKTPPDDKK